MATINETDIQTEEIIIRPSRGGISVQITGETVDSTGARQREFGFEFHPELTTAQQQKIRDLITLLETKVKNKLSI